MVFVGQEFEDMGGQEEWLASYTSGTSTGGPKSWGLK